MHFYSLDNLHRLFYSFFMIGNMLLINVLYKVEQSAQNSYDFIAIPKYKQLYKLSLMR